MKLPLRLSLFRVAALICLSACPSIYSGHLVQAASRSTLLDTDASDPRTPAAPPENSVVIPGPLQSLQRMAGISQKISPADMLPLLARNIYEHGYEDGHPTEYLVLIFRYLDQARRLQALAGSSEEIRVTGCEDAGALLQILGYRPRQGCGQKNFSLETANPERAFLTVDSGFPLVELEEALQSGTPFVYPYPSSRVPVLFRETDWAAIVTGQKRSSGALIDILLSDRFVAHLYWALAEEETETRLALQRSPGLRALLPYAGVLEFYGSQISIRTGRVLVPGGASAQSAWKELVGASPEAPGPFVINLVAKDKGWLAAYFDTLSRIDRTQQKHLTESPRLKRLYEALRSVDPMGSATQGVFRKSPDLLVLFSRVQWEPNGDPHVPGGLDVWKEILQQKTYPRPIRDWDKRVRTLDRPEQLLEAMTGLTRIETDIGPLQMYLMSIEIDRNRQPGNGLSASTLRLLTNRFTQFNAWYQVFAEFPALDDASIERFVNVADAIDKISNKTLRANTEGCFQANIGLWQILARQGQIPNKEMSASWQKVIEPFQAITSAPQLFDAARNSLGEVLAAAGGNSKDSQDEIVDLLAGPRQDGSDGQRVHRDLAQRILSVLDDQRLVSLDTLFALSDGLKDMAKTGGKGDSLLPLAAELREFDLPRPIFTNSEKIMWAPTIYTNHHAELQVRTDLTRVIQGPSTRVQMETARGQLAPFLRDTLVGLNYAYYEPPSAQLLHHNPLFVRSHDFLGVSVIGSDRLWGAPMLLGVGTPAGGGAYLMGSLADLSYALAAAEEDFISPKYIQALIWKELAPVLLVSSTLPRWWSVTPNELHAVALYQRSGEELLTASAANAQLRGKVIEILSERLAPQRMEEIERSLTRPENVAALLPRITPVETSYLAAEFQRRFPEEAQSWGPASRQLEDLRSRYAEEVRWERISRDFGVPHPTLARTNAREILNVKPFPFFGSYSCRLFGESWESGNLYWARIADEMGYSPAVLNNLAPELTRRTIANIFGTDLEDWPAVLRAMQETGEEFRQGKIASIPAPNTTAHGSEQKVSDATAH